MNKRKMFEIGTVKSRPQLQGEVHYKGCLLL